MQNPFSSLLFTVVGSNWKSRKRFRPLIPCFRVAFPRKKDIREVASVAPSSEKSVEKETPTSSQPEVAANKAAAVAIATLSRKRALTAEGKLLS